MLWQPRAIVYCWAIWSVVDNTFAPIVARVAPDYQGQLAFFTVDVDDIGLSSFTTEVRLATVPTLILCESGIATDRIVGFAKEDVLRARLDAWLQQ